MKEFKIIPITLLTFLVMSCSTIDPSVFETYNDNISSNVSILEENMQDISSFGRELFIIEASLERQDILDVEYIRNSPYEIELSNEPFYFTATNTINSLKKFNTFLTSYSNALLTIASNDFNSKEAIVTFNNSLKEITKDLDNDIVNYSISSSAVLIKNMSDRLSYRARIGYLQDVSSVSNDIVLGMLDRYIELIDGLEFIIFDYYFRTFTALENVMFNEEDFYRRREISRELVNLSEDYHRNMSAIYSIRNRFATLKETQAQLHYMIMNEDFRENTVIDFIIQNYDFYEGLE